MSNIYVLQPRWLVSVAEKMRFKVSTKNTNGDTQEEVILLATKNVRIMRNNHNLYYEMTL